MGDKDWYFFTQRDRKYPTWMRTTRATKVGYWFSEKNREIHRSKASSVVGMKKMLVFYKGIVPKGEKKTNWITHEYRLNGMLAYHYFSSYSSKVHNTIRLVIFYTDERAGLRADKELSAVQ
ncbi:hypothetical protein SAY87_030445 [Trapa incisa]|uniref:NAC domain-containing protein n=1 Tax=Trapa incisa TaxID=236973 RepID=A0AAN7KT28_9MYRT|nr:hypothetical protein SAY87_030445 [Trapa incisa]